MIKVVGYFVDRNGKKDNVYDVFVAIDEGYVNNLTYYAPIGQHSEGDREYINECEIITKEEYLKASSHLYTPKDYLDENNLIVLEAQCLNCGHVQSFTQKEIGLDELGNYAVCSECNSSFDVDI